uniref:(California timema) hypothetical protein n=1 Tax=Timema californicum TaxID=61474 RepID=A0A7R9P9H4_TIMCA|nr:unnamed protein product [Timema californicum]
MPLAHIMAAAFTMPRQELDTVLIPFNPLLLGPVLHPDAVGLRHVCNSPAEGYSHIFRSNFSLETKESARLPPEESLGVMFLDIKGYVRRGVLRTWHEQWVLTPAQNKLRSIRDSVSLWPPSIRKSRIEEVIVTRLCIGHIFLTQGFLLRGDPPPVCEFCDAPLSVYHILMALYLTNKHYVEKAAAFVMDNSRGCDLESARKDSCKSSFGKESDGGIDTNKYRMVFVINCDLGMGIGKTASQVSSSGHTPESSSGRTPTSTLGKPSSPIWRTPSSPSRRTPSNPPRSPKLHAAVVEPLNAASGTPEVGMSGGTGEAAK